MNKTEDQLLHAHLEALRHQMQSYTDSAARLAGQLVNDTLKVFTGLLPPNGVYTDQWKVAAGCITVDNLGATGVMYVAAMSPVNFDPTTGNSVLPAGTGVYAVPAGQHRTVPLASHTVAIYGTPGNGFSYAAFTAPLRPTTG